MCDDRILDWEAFSTCEIARLEAEVERLRTVNNKLSEENARLRNERAARNPSTMGF